MVYKCGCFIKIIFLLFINLACFIQENDEAEVQTQNAYPPNTYVRVNGLLRAFGGKRTVNAFKITPVTDMNELTCHMLEVIYASGSGQQQVCVCFFPQVGQLTAVPSLHFSSARGPARGAVVTRSHNPGSDVPAPVSVTQKNTF